MINLLARIRRVQTIIKLVAGAAEKPDQRENVNNRPNIRRRQSRNVQLSPSALRSAHAIETGTYATLPSDFVSFCSDLESLRASLAGPIFREAQDDDHRSDYGRGSRDDTMSLEDDVAAAVRMLSAYAVGPRLI